VPEMSTTNLGHLGRKGEDTFQNQIFHRRAATYTHTCALRPLHKTFSQICIHYIMIHAKMIQIYSRAFTRQY